MARIFYSLILVSYSFYAHSMHTVYTDKASIILSDKLWERILRFMPGDNLYRALWSRCYNASQEFYDEIINAYMQSHFVPDDLVQAVVNKHFLFFKGLTQEQIDFREKIISAFAKYTSGDTQKYRQYVTQVTNGKDPWNVPEPLLNKHVNYIKQLLHARTRERVVLKEQLKHMGKYAYILKDIKKLLSCLACYKHYFMPIEKKLAFVRILNKTKNWLDEHGIKLQAVFMLCIVHVLPMFAIVDSQKNIIITVQVFVALVFFVMLAKYGIAYACDELIDYAYDQYLLRIDYLEDIQKKLTVLLCELE